MFDSVVVMELRRPTTAAKVEMDWNCVTIE